MSPLLNGKVSSSEHRPDRFGPYQVRTNLGASRFGPVYAGHDPSTNTRVVIHSIQPSHEWRESGAQSDLLDSFRQLCERKLDHPGLARPLAFGAEGDIPYVVYSDLAGTTMATVVREHGARPVAEVLRRTRQLAAAIDFAAGAGVHHGTMTPGDVILDGEQTAITGFGLAQALTKAGIPAKAGVPYGSPQRLEGALPTRADDIYSLAAITLEFLIGTPADPKQDSSPALREAQGLPERRPRPAPHETRLFTTIPGVDAGKLRASFAAAFAEEPGERPSTAAEFVTRFEGAFSNRLETNEPAPKLVTVPFVSDEHEDPPSAPVLELNRAEDRATRTLLVAGAVAVSFAAAGFVGGFVFGQRSIPSAAKPQPTRASGEDPKPTASAAQTTASASNKTASSSAPIAATAKTVAPMPNQQASSPEPITVPVTRQATTPAVASGRLLIRSTPAGAEVVVDGQSQGVTPLTLRELAFGAHTIEVSHEGLDAQRKQVTLSERRPARMVDFELRSTSVPAPAAAATNAPGSLQVTSRPSGALVFVDDSLIGKTPLLVSEVAAGARRLRLELSGYKTFTTSIQIEQGARFRLAARLEQ